MFSSLDLPILLHCICDKLLLSFGICLCRCILGKQHTSLALPVLGRQLVLAFGFIPDMS